MKLARLTFLEEWLRARNIPQVGLLRAIYYRSNGLWAPLDLASSTPGPGLVKAFDALSAKKSIHRISSGDLAYVFIPQHDAVIEIEPQRPRTRIRAAVAAMLLREAATNAENAYDARHDELTGCLNRRVFERSILEQISVHVDRTSISGDRSASIGDSPPVALHILFFDIDNFKQVNDIRGHIYGDLVLQAFASRLRRAIDELAIDALSNVETRAQVFSRFGGEEFVLGIVGSISAAQAVTAADDLRRCLNESPLPSADEWNILRGRYDEAIVELPTASDRIISASVGVATQQLTSRDTTTVGHSLVLQSIDQADYAVAKAKTLGKNCVVHFDDIARKHGVVLEHAVDVGVVTIDLGERAGTRKGQLFLYYHPGFEGRTPYRQTDARSTRDFGLYPKIPSGQLEIFDLRPEISFCHIVGKPSSIAEIPRGSTLEAVATGTLWHLHEAAGLDIAAMAASRLYTEDALRAAIATQNDSTARVMVFRLIDMDGLASEYGQYFVQQSLVSLIDVAVAAIPHAMIAQVGVGEIACYERSTLLPVQELEVLISESSGRQRDIPKFNLGLFSLDKYNENKDPLDQSSLDCNSSILYARFAAFDAQFLGVAITEFNSSTAGRVVAISRAAGSYERAVADALQLRAAGCDTALLRTNLGMAFLNDPKKIDDAINEARAAVEIEPNSGIYHANLAIMLMARSYDDAALEFKRALERSPELPAQYLPSVGFTFAMARGLTNGVSDAELLGWIERAEEYVTSSRSTQTETLKYLRAIRDEIRSKSDTPPASPPIANKRRRKGA